MKQFLRSLFMLLMLVVWASGSFAQEKTYSYTFGTATEADFTSLNQTKTLNGKSWSLAVTPNNAHINTDTQTKGQQIGSKNNPVKKPHIQRQTFLERSKKFRLRQAMPVVYQKQMYLFL